LLGIIKLYLIITNKYKNTKYHISKRKRKRKRKGEKKNNNKNSNKIRKEE
jgi:hypothetical protein